MSVLVLAVTEAQLEGTLEKPNEARFEDQFTAELVVVAFAPAAKMKPRYCAPTTAPVSRALDGLGRPTAPVPAPRTFS
jgi:hypothetical protein